LLAAGCNSVTQSSTTQKGATTTHASISLQEGLPGASVAKTYSSVVSVAGGGPPYSFNVSTGQLPPGLSLNPTTGSISGTPTQASQFAFTISVQGNEESSGTRAYVMSVGPCNSCVTVQISPLNPSVAPGGKVQFAAVVTNTANSGVAWSASAGTITTSGLFTAPASATNNSVTITATSAAQSSAQAATTLSLATTKLTIANSSLPAATVGTAYDAQLAGIGGQPPYTWSIPSGTLPSGLKLASGSGTITGTATQGGTFNLTVGVTDAASHTAQQGFSLAVSNSKANCGPPDYNCSRSDLAIVQVPSAIPSVGKMAGANTIVIDPDFGNRIVRITDSNTDPAAPWNAARTFVSSSSGSADENLWNFDSSLFIVQAEGGFAYPFAFNPTTMQAKRLYASNYPSTAGLKLSDSGNWSRVNPNVLYQYNGTTIAKYDFTDRTNPPSSQVVFDFASGGGCLPVGFSPTWQSKAGVSAGDLVFGAGYSDSGIQGTGIYAVAYKVGHGCTLLNTKTGQVTGAWGAKGTINIPDRWTIHNVKLSKDGDWLIIMPQDCTASNCAKGPYFWQIGTTTVNSCGTSGHCGGHWTEGTSHWVNNNNSPMGNQIIRSLAETTTGSLTPDLPSAITAPFDQHQSWNNADPADSLPFFATTWSTTFPFPAPWYNEVIGVSTDGSGKIWRFAHTFITTRSQDFSVLYAIGSVSQDGRFFMFSSDWMGTLGSESGSQKCTVGADCRGDVFIVELN
jgi:hypothetical protein